MTEDELLRQIAAQPDELELKLVYADFLAELGDPRAEVIALAARGEPTLAERRRVKGIIQDHARRWLGPLEAIADPSESTFVGGFLHTLKLALNARSADLLSMCDEPRLATVRALDASTLRRVQPLGSFLRQPALAGLTRLIVSAESAGALKGAPVPFTLEALGLLDLGLLDLTPFEGLPVAQGVQRWELVTRVLFASLHAHAMFDALAGQLRLCGRVPELRLVAPYGVFEGVATWLMLPGAHAELLGERWPQGARWSIDAPGLLLSVVRGEPGAWPRLEVQVTGEGMRDVDERLSRLASVLVLLGPARLTDVHVSIPAHLHPTRAHRHAIKSAARRLRGATVVMGEETLVP